MVHVKKNHKKNLFAMANWAEKKIQEKPNKLKILMAPNIDRDYEKKEIIDVNLHIYLLTSKVALIDFINISFFDHVRWKRIEDRIMWPWQDRHGKEKLPDPFMFHKKEVKN